MCSFMNISATKTVKTVFLTQCLLRDKIYKSLIDDEGECSKSSSIVKWTI